LIKKKRIFFINKEIQSGAVAKSYIRTGFLIYEEMSKYLVIYVRRPLVVYDFLQPLLLDFLICGEICGFFFISVETLFPYP
jgi:hypothetical protein